MDTAAEVIYHGVNGPGGCLVEIRDGRGAVLGVVSHVVKHSPAGMGWGYNGSGPADCARSLLIAALGDDATCPRCRGRTLPGQSCSVSCDGGYLNVLPYMEFKFEVVSHWPIDGSWSMSRRLILDWLTGQGWSA